jgi:hypothetical protein
MRDSTSVKTEVGIGIQKTNGIDTPASFFSAQYRAKKMLSTSLVFFSPVPE